MTSESERPPLVLVADDDDDIRALVAHRLEKAGYEVVVARDGDEALRLALDRSPDLLLLDVAMPNKDGYAVSRELSAVPTAPPIIFLTAQADTGSRVTGLETGAVDYVVKPFESAELLARVRAALRTKLQRDTLAASAQTDWLTGLPNRAAFDGLARAAFAHARRYERPLSFGLVDLDNFKEINDTHGHAAGDAVLKEVAARLRAGARDADAVVRYGGDEFVLLLPETDGPGALRAAERMLMALTGAPVQSAPEPIAVHTSIGVAALTGDMRGHEDLVAAADGALYRAKEAGRDQAVLAD